MNNSVSPRYELRFARPWINSAEMARTMESGGEIHHPSVEAVEITMGRNCGIMIDAGAQLLSLVNQLAFSGREVTLTFEDGYENAMSYLNRLTFFEFLHPSVKTNPSRPKSSTDLEGTNPNVVEFKRICPQSCDKTIPTLLSNAVEKACSGRVDCNKLVLTTYTVFGELINNIYQHSETPIDGYAALQVYPGGNAVVVTVSDSGCGLLETLRPTLTDSPHGRLRDSDLILEMLEVGVSRFSKESPERGDGLRSCASHALKFRAELTLRLPRSHFHIRPYGNSALFSQGKLTYSEPLPFVRGTHFAFRFQLSTA